jgi:hypothetical protein
LQQFCAVFSVQNPVTRHIALVVRVNVYCGKIGVFAERARLDARNAGRYGDAFQLVAFKRAKPDAGNAVRNDKACQLVVSKSFLPNVSNARGYDNVGQAVRLKGSLVNDSKV